MLTWKGPRVADPQLKIRPEVETEVADPAAMEAILQALGFAPVLAMVKTRAIWAPGRAWRPAWTRPPTAVSWNWKAPGRPSTQAMAQLGLDADQIEPRSYAALYSGRTD